MTLGFGVVLLGSVASPFLLALWFGSPLDGSGRIDYETVLVGVFMSVASTALVLGFAWAFAVRDPFLGLRSQGRRVPVARENILPILAIKDGARRIKMGVIFELAHEVVVVTRFFDRVLLELRSEVQAFLRQGGKLTLILPANNELLPLYDEQRHMCRRRRLDTIEFLKELAKDPDAKVELRLYGKPVNNTIVRIDGALFLVGLSSHNHSDNDDLPTVVFESRGLGGPSKSFHLEIEALLAQTENACWTGDGLRTFTDTPSEAAS